MYKTPFGLWHNKSQALEIEEAFGTYSTVNYTVPRLGDLALCHSSRERKYMVLLNKS